MSIQSIGLLVRCSVACFHLILLLITIDETCCTSILLIESYLYRFCHRLLIFTLITSVVATTKCVQVYKRLFYTFYGVAALETRSATNFVSATSHTKLVNIFKSKKKNILMCTSRSAHSAIWATQATRFGKISVQNKKVKTKKNTEWNYYERTKRNARPK